MKSNLHSKTILKRNPNLLSSEIDGEIVMLSIKNGEYYNLNETGTEIWKIINEPCSILQLYTALMEIYDVSLKKCMMDTEPLIEEFVRKGIVKIVNE